MARKAGALIALATLAGLGALASFGSRSGQQIPTGPQHATTPDEVRHQIVSVARTQIGASNADLYWADVAPSLVGSGADWCGGFALWVLHQVGVALDKQWIPGHGFLLTGQHPLPTTTTPQPGDIAYFTHLQHEGIVESVNGDGTVTLINGDGNGHVVSEDTVPISSVTAFFSIAPMISQSLVA